MRRGFERSRIILGCAWVLAFAAYCPMLALSPIIHIVRQELAVSNEAMGILFSIPAAMLIVIAIPGGWLGDRLGARKAVAAGAIVMAVGSLMRGFAHSFDFLFAFTVVYGIGYGIMFPNLPKLMGIWFPSEKVGLATGIYGTGITVGGTLALALTLPVVFPLFTTIQGTFFFWAIPAGIGAILWLALSTDPPVPVSHGDWNAKGVIGPDPMLWKNKNMWAIALLLLLNNLHFYAWAAWTPSLLMMKGASPDLAALIASSRGWASLPAMFLMPLASYKLGLRKPFLWGSAILLMVSTWVTPYMPAQWGWALMAVVGITTGGTFSMMLALPVEMLPRTSVGMASGAVLSIGYIGGLIGPWLTGRVLDSTGNFDGALFVLVAIAALWAVVGFLIPETGKKPMRKPGGIH